MRKTRFRGKSSRKTLSLARAIYAILGVGLLAPALAVWMGLFRTFRSLPFEGGVVYPVAAGAVAYLLLHFIFRKPMTVYVFGHELTHAVAALLSGYKVKSLFVSEKGGEVELSDSNVLVALAPYCVPLYTAGVLLAYGLVRHYAALAAPPLWVGFGIGLTLAFHVALTSHSLLQDQPDLRHGGTFFSLVMIVLCNGVALVLVFKALFVSNVHLGNFVGACVSDTRILFERLWTGVCWSRHELARAWVK